MAEKRETTGWPGVGRDGTGRSGAGRTASLFAAEGSPEGRLDDVIFTRHRHALEVDSIRHGHICARDLQR